MYMGGVSTSCEHPYEAYVLLKFMGWGVDGWNERIKIYSDTSITRPVPSGWYSIAGYWNFCDQYFNNIGIHDLVDGGQAKAATYVEEATRQANYYHAEAMISYFGPSGYDVLSPEELEKYEAIVSSF